MKYGMAYASAPDELSKLVNESIGEGWRPIGGVAAVSWGMGARLYQAMVKDDAIPRDPRGGTLEDRCSKPTD